MPKRVLNHVRDRLFEKLEVEWPLLESEEERRRKMDRRVFSEKSDEELAELDEDHMKEHPDEPFFPEMAGNLKGDLRCW